MGELRRSDADNVPMISGIRRTLRSNGAERFFNLHERIAQFGPVRCKALTDGADIAVVHAFDERCAHLIEPSAGLKDQPHRRAIKCHWILPSPPSKPASAPKPKPTTRLVPPRHGSPP